MGSGEARQTPTPAVTLTAGVAFLILVYFSLKKIFLIQFFETLPPLPPQRKCPWSKYFYISVFIKITLVKKNVKAVFFCFFFYLVFFSCFFSWMIFIASFIAFSVLILRENHIFNQIKWTGSTMKATWNYPKITNHNCVKLCLHWSPAAPMMHCW